MNKFIIFLAFFLISSHTIASQLAVVRIERAVIYSDRSLTSPIGYVRKGRRIKVGSVKRKGGEILPIIVAGRINYIRVQDINLYDGKSESGTFPARINEHDVEDTFKDADDSFSNDNFLALKINSMSPGSDWQTIKEALEDEQNQSLMGIVLSFENHPKRGLFAWGVGLGYYQLTEQFAKINILTLEAQLYLRLLRFKYLSVEIMGGLFLSPDSRFRFVDVAADNAGVMWGHQAQGLIRLFPGFKVGIFGGIGIKSMYFSKLGEIELVKVNSVTELDLFSSLSYFAGLSIKFN